MAAGRRDARLVAKPSEPSGVVCNPKPLPPRFGPLQGLQAKPTRRSHDGSRGASGPRPGGHLDGPPTRRPGSRGTGGRDTRPARGDQTAARPADLSGRVRRTGTESSAATAASTGDFDSRLGDGAANTRLLLRRHRRGPPPTGAPGLDQRRPAGDRASGATLAAGSRRKRLTNEESDRVARSCSCHCGTGRGRCGS